MLKVIELFAGIGSQTQALKNISINHEIVAISEIDKYAVQSYEAIHGKVNNLGDIRKIDVLPQCDLVTYSFPCQDISVAGKGAGIKEGTRSGLLLEVERLLEVSGKPKYLLMENVKNLVGKKNKPDFDRWCEKLESLGYTNYWQVLNAKSYGIPQNRERVFMISILGKHEPYEFPKPFDSGIRLKDMLEDEIDERYYISDEKCEKLISQIKEKNQEISYCIDVNYYKGTTPEQFLEKSRRQLVAIPCLTPERVEKRQNGRRFKEDGEPMFTLTGQDRHGVMVKEATKQGFAIAYEGDSINLEQPNSLTRRGRVGKQVAQTLTTSCNQAVVEPNECIKELDIPKEIINDNERQRRVYSTNGISPTVLARQDSNKIICLGKLEMKASEQVRRVYNMNGIAPTLDTMQGGHREPKILSKLPQNDNQSVKTGNYRIRKLTPKECWRLMGFEDEQFQKAVNAGVSNSQLYKQAGNSIVVDVLEYIFKNLFQEVHECAATDVN